jgi:uncharacterized protein (TIGR00369 family)
VHTTLLPVGVGCTSLDLSVKFLGAVRVGSGTLTCTGTVTHLGKRTAPAEARLVDASGRLLASATSSCLILGGRPPTGLGPPATQHAEANAAARPT